MGLKLTPDWHPLIMSQDVKTTASCCQCVNKCYTTM